MVAFFSRADENYKVGTVQVENTEIMANNIKNMINADLFKIEPIKEYPTSYNEMLTVATNETEKGTAKEEVELKLADYLSEYYQIKYTNNTKVDEENAGDYVKIKGNNDGKTTSGYKYTISETKDENEDYKVEVKDKNSKLLATGKLTSKGKLSWENSSLSLGKKENTEEDKKDENKTLISQITSTNYGDEVNYKANKIEKWKIFYNDAENVYLIAGDYIPITQLETVKTKTGLTTTEIYQAYWTYVPAMQTISDSKKTKYLISKYDTNKSLWDSNDNMKAVSTLLNTENWTEFKDNTGYADWVIGSPTLEMYVASWNAKGYTALYCDNSNEYGYNLGTTTIPTDTYVDMSSEAGYNDTLYYPHHSSSYNCLGYWLASPSAVSTSRLMSVYYHGLVSRNNYYDPDYALRPLVCLNAEVKASKNGNGIWILSK